MKNGIDVSVYQGNIVWPKVKAAGIDFAILRAGYGRYASQIDEKFLSNYNGATQAGVKVGAYWYSYATTPAEAKEEAEACIKVLNKRKFDYPIYFDVEEQKAFNTGRNNVSAMIAAFCDTLENAGYYAGVYTSASAASAYFSDNVRKKYDIWVAHWGVSKPAYDLYGMWQNSDRGSVNGISGAVDTDIAYKDYPKIMEDCGFNGYPKRGVKPVISDEEWAKMEEEDNKKKKNITITIDGKTYKGTVTEV